MAGLFGLGRGKESGQAGSQAKTENTSSLLIKDATTASFSADVIAESARQPVLVDFWAPWCEPCQQLAPILEKTVKAAGGKVKLVKMNIDEHPEIPGRLGVRSIPAVIAFQRGKPVDGSRSRRAAFSTRKARPISTDGVTPTALINWMGWLAGAGQCQRRTKGRGVGG